MKRSQRVANCQLCMHLKDAEYLAYGGGKSYGGIPDHHFKFRVVGEPFIEHYPGTSARFNVLKQCPHCGTFYNYSYDYEFVGVGFDDDYELNRLTDLEGLEWAKRIFNTIAQEELIDTKLWEEKRAQTFNYSFENEGKE